MGGVKHRGGKGGPEKFKPKTSQNRGVRQRPKMEKGWLPGAFLQGPGGLWPFSGLEWGLPSSAAPGCDLVRAER